MGLAQFERRLERLVEGVFARAFRSGLQPVEIGRRLTREMDLRRQVAPKGVLAPNQFVVSCAPADRTRFDPIEAELVRELVSVAEDHARSEGYSLVGPVEVVMETDDDLSPGVCLVSGEMSADPPRRPPAGRRPDPRQAGRPRPSTAHLPPPPAYPAPAHQSPRPGQQPYPVPAGPRADYPPPGREPSRAGSPMPAGATLVLPDGRRLVLGTKSLAMGRLPECDLVLADPNVSRRHAEVRPAPAGGYEVTDLGSTNGTKVNGVAVRGPVPLRDGDEITAGGTSLRFEQG
ncbi:MAG: FhaA domain-containing protein [Acidimicrobiales bacterium]